MTTATFRFSPAILTRLGEELNQSPDQSILELVKNSYDANANLCTIKITNTTTIGGEISIVDDGDGMDANAIKNGWLILGKSSKESDVPTRLGRRPAGSKGLGRLAALRMGKEVTLSAVQRGNSRRIHHLTIDWSKFDSANVVEDVELQISTMKNVELGQGVTIVLKDLRAAVRPDEVKRLARSLLLLTDPFGDKANGFQVNLIAPEFKEVEALLSKKYFDQADYHLYAKIDANGSGSARILDWQGKVLAKADHAELRRKKQAERYKAPQSVFDLWAFLLGGTEFSARRVTKTEITDWLTTFGGVHVYQDEIRVAPYGNQGNDWLEMNLARVKSPEERPGTHNSIGRITVPGSGKYSLKQKTDRTGFIENDTFGELKEFAQDALNWMARWRLEKAELRRRNEKEAAPKAAVIQKDKVDAAIALAEPKVRKIIESAFSGYQKTRDKETDALKKEIQLYRTLSTAGITAATFSHEAHGNPLKTIDLSVTALSQRIPKIVKVKTDQAKLLAPVESIKSASSSLATLGTATLSLVRASKRRMARVSIHETIDHITKLMEPFMLGRDSKIEHHLCKGDPYLRTSEAAIESVFANLINNSLAAFERAATANRFITITTSVKDEVIEIVFADTGPGIADLKLSEIWLPGATTNPDGTGLGLTIVRDTVKDMGGKIDAVSNGPLGGAEFTILLPILGS
ncbi:sensor histidine kinase [Sideroxydans lithotrophicus]|uniref:histidine kinase n=1 Tax=Sideroxydans lithotrophicus (strain ES-1) TaxID=580332 RepID=D5CPL4_SIDLE|nr:sensor histidine kinase [Sideroxydans lithotrophicus]ADE13009.1 histidine kinase [Sideroxydans lithotrophicus ES-1]